jgi:predicted Zn-dependent protease
MVSNDTSFGMSLAEYDRINETRLAFEALLKQKRREAIEVRLQSAKRGLKKHQKIVGLKIIMLFGATLLVAFGLLFQKEEKLKATFELVQPDRISILYLQLLVNMDPDDGSLRLALARQHAEIGDANEAQQILEPLLKQHGSEVIEGKLLSLELNLNNYFAKTPSDSSKANDLITLKNKIGEIADENITISQFPEVIKRSLELGRPELAAKLYEHWADIDVSQHFDHIQDAGRWYVAAGMPLTAAEKYRLACESANNSEQARKFALLAIKAMQAADKTPLALAFTKEYLQNNPNDEILIDEAIRLSLASNDQQQALAWGNTRLKLQPENTEQISKQVDLALAAGNLETAWSLLEKLLLLKPNDVHIHERSAQIAEWSGKQALALDQWVWLAKQDSTNVTALENALRLADGLKSGETTLDLFTGLAEKRPFSEAELNYLVNAASHISNHGRLINLAQDYVIRYPSEIKGWEALANIQDKAGQLAKAYNTWNHIITHFGNPLPAVIHQADLLRRTGKKEFAFSKLKQNQNRASVNDTGFWLLYGDVSWEQKHNDNALVAYQTLWQSSHSDALVAERLIQSFRNKGEGQNAIETAITAHRQFHQPRWLLLAMDTAVQFKSWGKLSQLMQVADVHKRQFEHQEMYWLIRAQLHIHDHQPYQAMAAYHKALAINPASKIAKEGSKWTLMDLQNDVLSRIDNVSRKLAASYD